MDDLLLFYFGSVIGSAFVFGIIGAFIDERRGFWWGFFLGPIGWIIAAILKSQGESPSRTTSESQEDGNDSYARWNALKEVDSDIISASNRIQSYAAEHNFSWYQIEREVAERYFRYNDKQYLNRIVDDALLAPREEINVSEIVEIVAAGGQRVALRYSDDGRLFANTMFGSIKYFETIGDAKKYFG